MNDKPTPILPQLTPAYVLAYAKNHHPETTVGIRCRAKTCIVAHLVHIVDPEAECTVGLSGVDFYKPTGYGGYALDRIEDHSVFTRYLVFQSDAFGNRDTKVLAKDLEVWTQAYIDKHALSPEPEAIDTQV